MPQCDSKAVGALGPAVLLALVYTVAPVHAQDPNDCDVAGEKPDLILGSLDSVINLGTVGDRTAFSFGSTSCNVGTCEVEWQVNTSQHPVFGQNLYRLEQGRFEQIGLSWLTHRFFALSQTACSTACEPTNGSTLGVGCSSPNSAAINAVQAYMGPRFEVDPSTGVFPFPFTGQNDTGDAIYKRLQVHHDDLDPLLHPGAAYFAEGITLAADDAASGALHNNATYREVAVTTGGGFDLFLVGPTVSGKSALQAWRTADPEVRVHAVDVPGDGRFLVGSRATALGGGMWRYEYAVQNLNSHRAADRVSVAVPSSATLVDVGFHDVDYHSGEPFDGTDWVATQDVGSDPPSLDWSTESFAENENANALRWGTLYNYRFDADAPPETGIITLGLFRPGTPDVVEASGLVPRLCDDDGSCEPGENACGCPQDCGAPPSIETDCTDARDGDCDGFTDCGDDDCCGGVDCPATDDDGDSALSCVDCDDASGGVWTTPGEVGQVLLKPDGTSTRISWSPPSAPGGLVVLYEVLRSDDPADFVSGTACLDDPDPADHSVLDGTLPSPGEMAGYLVRAVNSCPQGTGSLGSSDQVPRSGTACP